MGDEISVSRVWMGAAIGMLSCFAVTPGHAAETCAEWMPPPATPGQVAPAAREKPTHFPSVSGEGSAPALNFIGDSLTAGNAARFPRTAAGDDARAYRVFAIGGEDSTTLADLFSGVDVDSGDVGVIWVGRNNSAYDQRVLDDVLRIAGRFDSGRYVVLGVLAGRYSVERPGQARRAQIDELNSTLSDYFGERFVKVTELLSCGDYNDNIHLTDAGYDKVARAVSARIEQLGF